VATGGSVEPEELRKTANDLYLRLSPSTRSLAALLVGSRIPDMRKPFVDQTEYEVTGQQRREDAKDDRRFDPQEPVKSTFEPRPKEHPSAGPY